MNVGQDSQVVISIILPVWVLWHRRCITCVHLHRHPYHSHPTDPTHLHQHPFRYHPADPTLHQHPYRYHPTDPTHLHQHYQYDPMDPTHLKTWQLDPLMILQNMWQPFSVLGQEASYSCSSYPTSFWSLCFEPSWPA